MRDEPAASRFPSLPRPRQPAHLASRAFQGAARLSRAAIARARQRLLHSRQGRSALRSNLGRSSFRLCALPGRGHLVSWLLHLRAHTHSVQRVRTRVHIRLAQSGRCAPRRYRPPTNARCNARPHASRAPHPQGPRWRPPTNKPRLHAASRRRAAVPTDSPLSASR